MACPEVVDPIRTEHLKLIALTAPFVEAVVAAEQAAAAAEIAARVGIWLISDPSHIVQLHLAEQAAEAEGFAGLGRLIVLIGAERERRVVGTVGFHGPPDERGRLEVSCRIHPAFRCRGYAVEAIGAMLDWATARYGARQFLVALPSRRERRLPGPVEITVGPLGTINSRIDRIGQLLEPRRVNR